jgi:hypothetical protein
MSCCILSSLSADVVDKFWFNLDFTVPFVQAVQSANQNKKNDFFIYVLLQVARKPSVIKNIVLRIFKKMWKTLSICSMHIPFREECQLSPFIVLKNWSRAIFPYFIFSKCHSSIKNDVGFLRSRFDLCYKMT